MSSLSSAINARSLIPILTSLSSSYGFRPCSTHLGSKQSNPGIAQSPYRLRGNVPNFHTRREPASRVEAEIEIHPSETLAAETPAAETPAAETPMANHFAWRHVDCDSCGLRFFKGVRVEIVKSINGYDEY